MKLFSRYLVLGMMAAVPVAGMAQTQEEEVREHESKLQVGGYGEATFTREFFSNNVNRYTSAPKYKNDPSHGYFDLPHAVIYLGYDFGKGWKMASEIEFEHGATGGAYEKEYEEGGEWEKDIEKGGEIELEQFWLQKTIFPQLNIKVGHIIVPVGLTNAHHEPLNFFTVYRPEGENTIMPCTWHETGISIWGRTKSWRYELEFLPGLDGMAFTRDYWIKKGAGSFFEFKVANKYAVAGRVDNYSIPGLRIGVSGYYGQSLNNSVIRDGGGFASKLKGKVAIGAFDFTYNAHNWIVRGNFDYGHLTDADQIQKIPYRGANNSPYNNDPVGKAAIAYGGEAGYDIFSRIPKLRDDNQKLYVFGRYEYYNSYIAPDSQIDKNQYRYTRKNRMAFGINYFPIPQIVVKAEYSKRFLDTSAPYYYNNEPSISLGIAYQGFFTK